MPNHVTNELKAAPYILDLLRNGEQAIDFERIVPMPEILKGDASLNVIDWALVAMGVITVATLAKPTGNALDAFKAGNYGAAADVLKQSNVIRMLQKGPYPKDFNNEDFERLLRCMRAIKETGFATWYEWSTENWGTKWNAYEAIRKSEDVIHFDTAWSAPFQWFRKLIEKFPGEPLALRWADEDAGDNTGAISVNAAGYVAGGRFEDGSVEAHQLYLELKHGGEVPDYMTLEADGRCSIKKEEKP
jgi:hypothetical protein